MLTTHLASRASQRGFTLIEILVTVVILAFGLLGLAGLQAKTHLAELEAYQRSQALVLLGDMVERINGNRQSAAAYVTGTANPLGVNDTQAASCTTLAAGVARDQCEWSNELKGAAEQKSSNDTTKVGAMLGARGCIEQVQAPNPAAGVCAPGVYRVSVTWQGLSPTVKPTLTCGASSNYGNDAALQRLVSSQITVALLGCS